MAAVFGANGTAARLSVGEMSPLVLVSLRWLFVTVLLSFILTRAERRAVGSLLRAHPVLLGWMGLFGYSGFNALYYIAAYRTTAVNLTLLQSSIPAFVLIGAAAVLHTKVRMLQLIGMGLTLLGVMIVATKGDLARLSSFAFNSGDVMVLVACVFYAAYTVGLRTRPAGASMVFFAGVAITSTFWSLPMAAGEILAGYSYWPSLKGWVLALLIAVGPSFSGQLCYMRGVDLIGPARAGLFANLIPIFGALTAVVILHERFTFAHGLAVALGLGGISLAEWRGGRSAAPTVGADHAEAVRDPQLP